MLHIQKIEKKATYEDTTKICSKCGVEQPIENFGRSSGAKYRRTECNKCNRELVRVRKQLKEVTPPPPTNHVCPICEKTGEEIIIVQIAGLIARRIVCEVEQGQELKQGDRIGMIRFGSRVDIYFKNKKVLAKLGQNVIAGESLLASQ